jgi:acyl carrier protein
VILESVVLVREDVVNDKRLVAYVVVKDKQLFHGSTIRQQLREKLPDYMLPGHFVVLEKMPITVNGKIDRHVLPMPMYDEINDQQEFVAARSEMELRLSRIWCDVLSIDKTGVFNNFFELGGHSLLATQVISKINSELSVDVPLRQIFETPTIEALAKSLEKISQIDVETNIVPLIAVPREQAHPLSFAQQRLWILDQLDPANPAYNISGAVRLQGALDQDALEQALGDVIKRHEPLRTSFVEEEGEVLQKINAYRGFLLPVRILTGKDLKQKEQQARKIAGEEAQWGFDLSRGPLFRARLLCLSESDHILLMNMHHIISDGWSMQIIVEELAALYECFTVNSSYPLMDLPIQYVDYSHWQKLWLQGDVLEQQLNYWKQQLSGVAVLSLPTDRPRPTLQTYRGSVYHFKIPKKLKKPLDELCRSQDVTLYMMLLASFQILLARYSGQTDVAVGSPIAGRNRSELESLVGFLLIL